MNAITIQKSGLATYKVTTPAIDTPVTCEGAEDAKAVVLSRFDELSLAYQDGEPFTTIPQRLENQGKMIQSFAVALNCPSTGACIRGAIANLKRGRESSDKQLMQVTAERDGLNKLFDGVKVERDADGSIVKIIAKNTVERPGNGVAEVTFDKPSENYHRTEIHGVVIERDATGRVTTIAFPKETEAGHDSKTHAGFTKGGVILKSEPLPVVASEAHQLCDRCGAEQPDTRTGTPPFYYSHCVHCGAALPAPVMTSGSESIFTPGQLAAICHKEAVLVELRRLWGTEPLTGKGVWLDASEAQRISNLLSSPPVFHEPGESETTTDKHDRLNAAIMEFDHLFWGGDTIESAAQIIQQAITLRSELDHCEAALTQVRADLEKAREAASVLCGAHIGKSFEVCPACETLTHISDLKLACQQRAEALLENESLKDRERQARCIAGKFIPLFDL